MSYLPGVPNMGPAPVSPMAGRKPGNVQHLGNPMPHRGAGFTSIGGGDPSLHSLGHYGKKPSPLLGGAQNAGGVDPTAHSGAKIIRGGSGGIRSHVREGGLGPGPMSAPGPSDTDYSMNSQDTE